MRILSFCIVLSLLLSSIAFALPTSLEEFQTQIADQAKDPKGAAKLWFDAVMVYIGGDKELGTQLITEMTKDKDWYKPTSFFVMALDGKQWIFRSYAAGTTPEGGYQMDPETYELVFEGDLNMKPYADKEEGQYCKLFVRSSGADKARPMTFQRNARGEFKAEEYSSIYSECRPPVGPEQLDDDLPESTDPNWTFRHWLQGILKYHAGDKDAGLAQMKSVMKDKEFDLRRAFPGGAMESTKSHVWRSYAKGTSPENGYQVDDIDAIETDTYFQEGEAPTADSTTLRMFARSTGADAGRPMRMAKDSRGQWRMTEWSSLCSGIRPPKNPKADDF